MLFTNAAEDMGLEAHPEKGLYSYEDQYSTIVYRQLFTEVDQNPHPTDYQKVPVLAIFTKKPDKNTFKYIDTVSLKYKFVGNDKLNQNIRDSIQSVGMPILEENTILNKTLTRMRTEMIIQNGTTVPSVGDVLPVMIVNNSYDGTLAASVAFGISIVENGNRMTFSFKMGEMRQIHISHSNTKISSSITSFIGAFSENITDMITNSFNKKLDKDDMLGALDMVEKLGKKKRKAISAIMEDIQTRTNTPYPTSWHLFLAIVRYSSLEPNLNMKRLLENIAEGVLVVPPKMYNVLEQLG